MPMVDQNQFWSGSPHHHRIVARRKEAGSDLDSAGDRRRPADPHVDPPAPGPRPAGGASGRQPARGTHHSGPHGRTPPLGWLRGSGRPAGRQRSPRGGRALPVAVAAGRGRQPAGLRLGSAHREAGTAVSGDEAADRPPRLAAAPESLPENQRRAARAAASDDRTLRTNGTRSELVQRGTGNQLSARDRSTDGVRCLFCHWSGCP